MNLLLHWLHVELILGRQHARLTRTHRVEIDLLALKSRISRHLCIWLQHIFKIDIQVVWQVSDEARWRIDQLLLLPILKLLLTFQHVQSLHHIHTTALSQLLSL